MLEENEIKVIRKIVGKTKIDRIRSHKTRESCCIQPINEWVERRTCDVIYECPLSLMMASRICFLSGGKIDRIALYILNNLRIWILHSRSD